ncbi:MAG: hypothetical protein FPO08_07430 [Geobacter sp.]|nr:MAG: hypothetical protein FPO08_07430 [Geobacter sp.]
MVKTMKNHYIPFIVLLLLFTSSLSSEAVTYDRKIGYLNAYGYTDGAYWNRPDEGSPVASLPKFYVSTVSSGTFTVPITFDYSGGDSANFVEIFLGYTSSPYSANPPVGYISTTNSTGAIPVCWVYDPSSSYKIVYRSTISNGKIYGYAAPAYTAVTGCSSPRSFPATNPSVSAGTKISATHFVNLMSNINYLRTDAGLAACNWTKGSAPTGRKIYAADINDLRACLAQVYTTCSGSCGATGGCSSFNITATAGTSKIVATDISNLVTGINAAP